MNILITGAKGFVGKNLTEALKNIRDAQMLKENKSAEGDRITVVLDEVAGFAA